MLNGILTQMRVGFKISLHVPKNLWMAWILFIPKISKGQKSELRLSGCISHMRFTHNWQTEGMSLTKCSFGFQTSLPLNTSSTWSRKRNTKLDRVVVDQRILRKQSS